MIECKTFFSLPQGPSKHQKIIILRNTIKLKIKINKQEQEN
jgi:hypothetical protein